MIAIVVGLVVCALPLSGESGSLGARTALGVGAMTLLGGGASIMFSGWGGWPLRFAVLTLVFVVFALLTSGFRHHRSGLARHLRASVLAAAFSVVMVLAHRGTRLTSSADADAYLAPRRKLRLP